MYMNYLGNSIQRGVVDLVEQTHRRLAVGELAQSLHQNVRRLIELRHKSHQNTRKINQKCNFKIDSFFLVKAF